MAKVKKAYFCSKCGFEAPKWLGRCPSCGEWNTFTEEIISRGSNSAADIAADMPQTMPQRVSEIQQEKVRRLDMCNSEVNRVLGGGLVPGSLVLLGGEPGIGKSTLSLQLALSSHGLKTLYVSGEESAEQIGMRAERLGIENEECYIYSETLLENILLQIKQHQPDIVVIDSIQTIYTESIDSSAGSVSQIRECAAMLLKYAKTTGTSIFIIGHITKDGAIAGPKILEHIVDVVLQFEGDGNSVNRILRGIKNRFGATYEIGVFEMIDKGLRAVENPSEILLSHYDEPLSGIAVGASVDGIRPYLIEVQALVSNAVYGTPQRNATGFDARRMSMLLAVLEKRVGMKLFQKDVFLNFAGGFKVADPGLDLSVVSAVISSYFDRPVAQGVCCAGEIGLSGEVRPAPRTEQRVAEAARLGFKRIIVSGFLRKGLKKPKGIEVVFINNLGELPRAIFCEEI
ncbi:MAG: DNA repair protein RadA [Alistipes sp.]|nr:DNA repair protein RadA [Alistipes sp.]MDO5497369.1 DNA repair protein RadA [Alistipes sp.]